MCKKYPYAFRYKLADYKKVLLNLCGIGAIGWVLMYMCHHSIQPISRRMANLSYCIWVVCILDFQLQNLDF